MDTCAISIENVSKSFDTVTALEGLTLEIPSGTIFGFIGPNGAGKTTTIRLLLGLLEPTQGHARVLGFDTQSQADQIRAHTGALLEHSGIYEQMTARDNLAFYGRVFRMPEDEQQVRIEYLLKHMGLWERRADRAGSWSRGMKQKLALARTLLHRPQLVLLDEPTAGLDVASTVAIRKDLQSMAEHEHITIFLTSHNMADVEKLCSLVAIIREGKLVALGSPDELRTRLGGFRMEITGSGFSDQVNQLLRENPDVHSLSRQNGQLMINLVSEGDSTAVVRVLLDHGAQIDEVRRNTASLEEVFLRLTGENDV